MANRSAVAANTLQKKTGFAAFWTKFKRNWQLHLMMLLPVAYYFIFHYVPLFGLQIAFRDFKPRAGIWNSEWVGLKNFMDFFAYYKWSEIVWNTMAVSLYSLIVGFPIPIILALVLHINKYKVVKKLAQNISYIPHFISTVVMVGILNQVLNPVTGLLGAFQNYFGIVNYTDIRASEDAFRHLYVWSGIWQTMGWSTILYVSALSSVSEELHEAAKIDGASRWRRVLSVDLPAIMPTIAIRLILRSSSILSVGYEKVYLMQNSLNLDKSEVISTYVYKYGLGRNNLGYGSAVGLMNSVINTSMLLLVNWITNRLSDNEVGLF